MTIQNVKTSKSQNNNNKKTMIGGWGYRMLARLDTAEVCKHGARHQ